MKALIKIATFYTTNPNHWSECYTLCDSLDKLGLDYTVCSSEYEITVVWAELENS